MKIDLKRIASAAAAAVITFVSAAVLQGEYVEPTTANAASNVMLEYLNRGISAVNTGSGMLVSWRYLANDDDNAVYKLYRDGALIYTSEAGKSTCYLDKSGSATSKYRVDTFNSKGSLVNSEDCKLISNNSYFEIPMSPPSSIHSPNDMSVGDVDGDGQYELFVKWDPNNSKDNSIKGKTDSVYIDCVRLDGKRLWRIDLGVNIRAGAHYTQFFVGDFDLDGKAEMTCKTADGTKDGQGNVIGDGSKNYRNGDGLIITGPEYYTLFEGETGKALDTVDYEPGRGDTTKWGKSSDKFNRVDRFWGTAAYLDGVHPCIVTGRGYYGRMTATAYKVENKKLVKMWMFDTGTSSSALGYGDGNHNTMPADVDGDGKQEIITGSTCIDDNGKLLWCTNQGHGDAMHVGDLDPTNPGIEAWICHEDKPYGVSLVDCDTGKIIFHNNGSGDTGRCCGDNVWAGNPGAELWGNKESDGSTPVKNVKGETLSCNRPAINFLIHWDGDLEREILDGYTDSPAKISKMNENGKITQLMQTDGYYTCNTTKGTPCLSADIFGDWREELIVRAADSKSVRIYCTPYDTDYRITTLMHDAHYRMQVSAQNTAYNQPPHTSFFLGTGYDLPKRPTDTVNTTGADIKPVKNGAVINTGYTYKIKNKNSGLYLEVADSKAENGANVQQGTTGAAGWRFVESDKSGYYYVYSELGDGKTFLLDLDFGKPDNGTNIGIYGNTSSDAQLFKLVDNGDGTYAIKGLTVKDSENYQDWNIKENAANGDLVFGDRDVVYTQLPEFLNGAEMIQTACDSKNMESDLAEFTAAEDIKVYIALDTRVESSMGSIPEWMNGWTKTGEQAANDKDITFDVYENSFKKGETVRLGSNSTNYNVVNYTVFVKEDKGEPAATTTAEPIVTTSADTTVSQPVETTATAAKVTYGDANCDGKVEIADATLILQFLTNKDEYSLTAQGLLNADVSGNNDGVTAQDALVIQQVDAGIYKQEDLPIK